jgi:nicotinate (nicotinamide) nucleotide adenylyltransferase
LVVKLEKAIGDLLRENGMTLSVAESCTGGLVSDRITDVPGSSDYYEGGVVSYGVQAKAKHLGIPLKYIERYGAVSPQVAERMAEGVRKVFKTTYGLSTTGVAGPTGGTEGTPVGTVFIAVADGRRTAVEKLELKGSRRAIKREAAERGLRLLSEQLSRLPTNPPVSPLPKGREGKDSRLDRLNKSKQSEIVLIRRAPKGIKKRGRLGIFPASFNPPTLAHLALIREAKKQGGLDEILILLDMQAMDKEPTGAGFQDRLAMLRKAFGKDPKISIGLANRGLFLEKLKPLRHFYPSPISLFFIVGFDTIVRVTDKKYYRNRSRSLNALFSQCHFLVANREKNEGNELEGLLGKTENEEYRGKVSFLRLPGRVSFLSSSLIRHKISRRQPIKGEVPSGVRMLIEKRGLYKKGNGKRRNRE